MKPGLKCNSVIVKYQNITAQTEVKTTKNVRLNLSWNISANLTTQPNHNKNRDLNTRKHRPNSDQTILDIQFVFTVSDSCMIHHIIINLPISDISHPLTSCFSVGSLKLSNLTVMYLIHIWARATADALCDVTSSSMSRTWLVKPVIFCCQHDHTVHSCNVHIAFMGCFDCDHLRSYNTVLASHICIREIPFN